MCENGIEITTATMNKPLPPIPSLPAAIDPPGGGVRVSITNQRGQRYRYRAQTVSLNIRKGMFQVIENTQGCFLWFDRCNLEIRNGVRNLLFDLKTGAASNIPGVELVILAELAPSATTAKRHRRTRSNHADTTPNPSKK